MHEIRGGSQPPGAALWWVRVRHGAVSVIRHPSLATKTFFFVALIFGLAIAGNISARTGDAAVSWLFEGGSFLVLLAWIGWVAIPLVTKGTLPDGRYLPDVLASRRARKQRAGDYRQSHRRWRRSANYQPHAHRRPDSLPPQGRDT